MATNGYGPAPGHIGRIPTFGKTQVNPMGSVEPPACIQNAMMTKDKKPFTYTPGGLDLSQIRTPSMARRMARQKSWEDQEQAYGGQHGGPNYHPQGGPGGLGAPVGPGGPVPPPPPPPSIPAPPPPPPLVIEAPNSKSPKPVAVGERPEIVIPENPIGMLRKTNSPYHWEAEKADLQRMGPVPKFVEKVPSPLTVKLPQNQPQNYAKPFTNTIQQNQSPGSPLYKPEALYAQNSPPVAQNGTPPTRDILVRQDSQFNKSPQPFANQSSVSSNSPYSPTPNNHWRQPEKRDSDLNNNSPQSPYSNRGPFSPNVAQTPPNYQQSPPTSVFHTLPRVGQRNQDNFNNQNNYESQKPEIQSPNVNQSNPAPWRTNTINRYPRENQNTYNEPPATQQTYSPPWKRENLKQVDNLNAERPEVKPANQGSHQQEYIPPWVAAHDNNNNRIQNNVIQNNVTPNNVAQNNNAPWRGQEQARNTPPTSPLENRYQSSISIPITPKKQTNQPDYNNNPANRDSREIVYINQEPVYYCPPDSPKAIPPWVKTQKEKTKTPPPAWCQRPLEGRKSLPRELVTPPRETNNEPEWVKKSNEMQRGAREIISPPKYQQPVQPNWSTLPSENRKSVPRDNQGSRIIPIQMEVSSTETRNHNKQANGQPQMRIVIDMQQNPNENHNRTQAPYSQPTQRIMRVLSPQLVRLDDQPDLPSLNRNIQNQDSQPKTRIIPIQVEGNGNGGANKSFGGRF
ncbi:extensin-2 isoform X2 [Aricia agestis]|uniref:extensin-2 isoform X2 n=1 Tax=Aricia agestis TaxID=91739 RepID=UPI001C20486B|nr:extensin-2 isoform X2 [Aricia agestis]